MRPSDPVKSAAGALSLKAYRLTKQAMELVKERGYFNFDTLKSLKVGHENMFQELKVSWCDAKWGAGVVFRSSSSFFLPVKRSLKHCSESILAKAHTITKINQS